MNLSELTELTSKSNLQRKMQQLLRFTFRVQTIGGRPRREYLDQSWNAGPARHQLCSRVEIICVRAFLQFVARESKIRPTIDNLRWRVHQF